MIIPKRYIAILFAMVGLLLLAGVWFFANKEPQREAPALTEIEQEQTTQQTETREQEKTQPLEETQSQEKVQPQQKQGDTQEEQEPQKTEQQKQRVAQEEQGQPQQQQQQEQQQQQQALPSLSFEWRKKISEGTWAIPLRLGNNFLVTHGAGDIIATVFDDNWNVLRTKTLYSGTPRANDHQSAVLNNELFLVYSASVNEPDDTLWLLKFDSSLNLVDSLEVVKNTGGKEVTNDMFLTAAEGKLYVGTFATPHPEPVFMKVRVFDTRLNLLETRAIRGMGIQNGGAFIVRPDAFYYISGVSLPGNPNRDLHAIQYSRDWQFLGDIPLSQKSADEYWPMGGVYYNGFYYIAHVQKENINPEFCPTCDMGQIILKVYDTSWRLIEEKTASPNGVLSQRPHVLKYGDKIYVGYDTAKGDFGPFEGWVAQFKETKL